MRKITALSVLLAVLAPAAAGQRQIALPERYKKWLDEEVVYIITSRERDVFLQLRTDRERDIFVEAFWKHRDADPTTPRNEFQEEHYRRLEFANKVYGRSTPLPGWRTDRGRIHILLGPPRNIESYANVNGVHPVEIWFYLGDPSVGLPAAFNVIFFKRDGHGDYILYSPTEHGPRSLVASAMGDYRDVSRISGAMSDAQAAYNALRELEPNLARQTLSLIPGEAVQPGYESLASNRVMATIFASPHKRVDIDYADAILKYKDFVEVEYTANYVSSEIEARVIRDETGAFFVHYTVEPAKISVEPAGGRYEARFVLTGRVSDDGGRTVYQFEKDFPFSLTGAELEEARANSVSLQDAFPLVPGRYTFDILVKNVLSKEFSGGGRAIVVPGPGEGAVVSPLILAYGVEPRPSPAGERVPFKLGGRQLLTQSRKTFTAGDSLGLFFQLEGLTEELERAGSVRYQFLREDKEFLSRTARVSEARSGPGFFLDVQPLAEFPPGYYQARVSVLDGQGREVAFAKENFEVSLAKSVPRPMVVSKVVPAVKPEDDLFVTGIQLMNIREFKAARRTLAEAHGRDPARPDIAVAYSQALFRTEDYAGVREVLLPFAGGEEPAAEVLALLGQACQALDLFGEAASHYAAYLSRFGINLDILNYLGTCLLRTGSRAEALKAWERSLEINPDQPKLRELVESLKKK